MGRLVTIRERRRSPRVVLVENPDEAVISWLCMTSDRYLNRPRASQINMAVQEMKIQYVKMTCITRSFSPALVVKEEIEARRRDVRETPGSLKRMCMGRRIGIVEMDWARRNSTVGGV